MARANKIVELPKHLELISSGKRPLSGLSVVFPYDLRSSMMDKCSKADSRWAAYVNNSGTLCHIVSPEAEILVRLSFKSTPMKKLSEALMRVVVIARLNGWIKL